MADPYLQLTFDAKRRVALAARSVDLPPGTLAWGLWEVWEDVWRRKDASVPPHVLAGCLGTDPRIVAAFVLFGFLVEANGAHRLAEEDERRILLTHQQRVAAGKARIASAERSAGGVLVGRSSESPASHQRPTSGTTSEPPAQDQRNAPPAASSQQRKEDLPRAPPAGPRVKKDTAGKKHDGDPREGGDATYKALVDALFVLFLSHRGSEYAPAGKDWAALAQLRGKFEGSEIIRRWGIGLQARYAARCSTFWDLRERWNACAQPEAQGPAQARQEPDVRKGTVRAEDQDHLHGPPGAHEF